MIETVPRVDDWQTVLNAFEVMGLIHTRISLILARNGVSAAATGEWRLLELCDRGAVVELDKFFGIARRRTVVIPIADLVAVRPEHQMYEADYVAWFREGVSGTRKSKTDDIPLLPTNDSRTILLEDE